METVGIGNTLFYARIHHQTGIYDLCELHVRTIYEECFVGVDADTKQAFLISNSDLGCYVFKERSKALDVLHEAEKNKKNFTTINEGDY